MFRLRKIVYLDNNATTTVSENARKAINYVLKHCYGNPASLYKAARDSAAILDESRKQVAKAINAEPGEIIFTGSASEANNCILKSASEYFYPQKKKLIATPLEHASVISTLEYLKLKRINVEYAPVDRKGRVIVESLERKIDSDTYLISIMYANNETGTIQDIKQISAIAKKHGVLMMSDCVQALGKIPVDVKSLGLDYASFSAHKIHGPKGVGAMYVREGAPIAPIIHGGHQEFGLRAGTEGLHNIAGFASACKEIQQLLKKAGKVSRLKEELVKGLKSVKADIRINSPEEDCLPNTASITFPDVNNAVFMAMLDYHGISVSAGSACNTQDDAPSHVLKAIGLSDEDARQTIRFSLSTETSQKDVHYVLKVIGAYFSGKIPPVDAITPSQLNENLLLDKNSYILDVRFWHDRKMLKGLPNSHEAAFFNFGKYAGKVPRNKNIIVVCQLGYNSPIVAYNLKSKHYKNVGFLLGGLLGWKIVHPDLYRRYAGQNIVKLDLGGKE